MSPSPRTTDDYETLRAAVLRAEPPRGPDLGMLRHRGLTSWLRAPVPRADRSTVWGYAGSRTKHQCRASADDGRTYPSHRRHCRRPR